MDKLHFFGRKMPDRFRSAGIGYKKKAKKKQNSSVARYSAREGVDEEEKIVRGGK